MSYIEAINQAATASAQSGSASASESNDIMGKEDFLTLLVAQLQNQDPLNPDDPTEFTAQLAQFSSLEQLFNLNDSMDNVADSVSSSQKLSALSMIGKEVTYADSSFAYSGTPVQIGYSLDGDASEVVLTLKLDGATVATLEGTDLSEGDHYLTWNGLDSEGNEAPEGIYTLVLQASAESGSVAASPLVRSEVTGVDLNGDNGGLLYTKGGEVSLFDIKGVYELGSNLEENNEEDNSSENEGNVTVSSTVFEHATANDATLGEAAAYLSGKGYNITIEDGLAYIDNVLFTELNDWEAGKNEL